MESALCPECWELNDDESACVLVEGSGCFDLSCDDAKLSFNFEPKLLGLSGQISNFNVI